MTIDTVHEPETTPGEVLMPVDLAKALAAEPTARRSYDAQTADGKRWIVLAVESARSPAVRRHRIATAVAALVRAAEA